MRKIKEILIYLIVIQLVNFPVVANVGSAQVDNSSSFIKMLRSEVMKNSEQYFDKDDLDEKAIVESKALMLQENREILEKMKDETVTLLEIKKEINHKMMVEERAHMLELKGIIESMPMERAEELFYKAIDSADYPAHLRMEYLSAHTETEKKSVILQLIITDIGVLKSKALFKIGRMSASELKQELVTTENLITTKRGEGWKMAAVIVISVALAGLASWGIVRASKKRHERKMKELLKKYENLNEEAEELYKQLNLEAEADFYENWDELYANHQELIDQMLSEHAQSMTDTQAHYDALMQELKDMFAERARLRDAGYVWAVCSVTENTVTKFCSYNQTSYSGVEVCATHCLKHPITGHVVEETSLVCTNSKVPTNCDIPNAYNTGYSAGDSDGYSDGYDTGYDNAYASSYNSAYNDLYTVGYNEGKSDGYDTGFAEGYADGLANAQYDSDQTYWEGYDDGEDDAYDTYDDGYYWGNQDANATYQEGRLDGLSDSTETYYEGYPVGYADGYSYAQSLQDLLAASSSVALPSSSSESWLFGSSVFYL